MTFKELKSDFTVFIFDRTNHSVKESKVISVSMPRYENKVGATPTMVCDVTLEADGKQQTYVFPDNASRAYCGNTTFYIDKTDVLNDIKSIKRASEQAIADVDKHRQTVAKCNQLLSELDTEEKQKQEMENRLNSMESRFDNIESLLKQIANKTTL